MSTDYDVCCLTCTTEEGPSRAGLDCFRYAYAFEVFESRKALAVLAKTPVGKYGILNYASGYVPLEWFGEHEGHELAMISEYGEIEREGLNA